MLRPILSAALVLLAACGDDGGGTGNPDIDAPAGGGSDDAGIDSSMPDTPGPAFTVTSPAIMEGGTFPLAAVCVNKGGADKSPELVFSNPPPGTMSYAVVLTDLTNMLVHCAIYDIPATATGLVADVDKVYAPPDAPGAHQTLSISNQRGYAGPCPPSAHMYQFKVYALPTAVLPMSSQSTSKEQVVMKVATNLGTATLTTTFTP